jgi:thymidylate synthase
MINIIIAVDGNYGIGKSNKLAWKISEDLKIFKEKTTNTVCIVGAKTFEDLPNLPNRTVIPISRYDERYIDFDSALYKAGIDYPDKEVYIIGGGKLYEYVLNRYRKEKLLDNIRIHISFLKNIYDCDTFFDKTLLKDFYIETKTSYDDFEHCEMIYKKYGEYQYINLIEDIIENGDERIGRNGIVISSFCKHLKFDLREGFPLLTTKKMFIKGIIEELLFFIRGDTNSKILEEKGINIWKGNTNREFLDTNGFNYRKEGEMGPMYGYQWRHFNSISNEKEKYDLQNCKYINFIYKAYNKDNASHQSGKVESIDFDIDQLKFVINEIKTNPTSRRILLTSFNPSQVEQGVLYPCHSIILQFYVQDEYLDMFCYNRSNDNFHGTPFNIASSSLLLMIIAQITNLVPRFVNISQGDSHIYGEHINAIREQILRIPYVFPKLILPEFTSIEDVEKLTYSDFKLENYNSYPTIKRPMIA